MRSKQFIKLIDDFFSEEDLRTLCFDLGVDYDSLPGRGKIAKIRELILVFQRRDETYKLINSLFEERPNVPWNRFKFNSKVPTPTTTTTRRSVVSSQPNEWREIKKKLGRNQRSILALAIIFTSWISVVYSFYLAETPLNFQSIIALLVAIAVFYSLVVISYRSLMASKTAIWILFSCLLIFSLSFSNEAFLTCFLMPAVSLTTIGYLQFLKK
ncbi:hypothetical protein [Candidatus Leptofilum sp.]|uniref:hypothetical protein n=1 Tax=Candidatus Leptofilum sp. TaxID=3241576 RepID=UPI003B597C4E